MSLRAPDGSAFDVYVARPEGVPRAGIVLIHEIWGLVPHIMDIADRFASQGYLVAAPDVLSHGGIEPALGADLFARLNDPDEEVRVAAQPDMRDAITGTRAPDYAAWAVQALRAVVDWLDTQEGATGRIGVVGFCFGGTFAYLLAASDRRIRAAVPFYGAAPSADRIPDIEGAVLAVYGQHDPSLIDALPDVRERMTAAGVDFETVVYPEAEHAFFNDGGRRYRAGEAADAWQRTLVFFEEQLEPEEV